MRPLGLNWALTRRGGKGLTSSQITESGQKKKKSHIGIDCSFKGGGGEGYLKTEIKIEQQK